MPEALKRQIGPFTLGVWLLILAAGLALGLVARRALGGIGGGGGDEVESGPIEREVVWASGAYATQGAVVEMNGGSPVGYGGTGGPGDDTNDRWIRTCVTHLIKQGVDPGLADRAIRKYVKGDELTQAEAEVVNRALTEVGVPPRQVPVMKVKGAEQPSTVPPSPVPNLSTGQAAWLSALESEFLWLDAFEKGEVQGDPGPKFARLAGMGVKSSNPRMSIAMRHKYRAWLNKNGFAGKLN